jgi:hypothetical protein
MIRQLGTWLGWLLIGAALLLALASGRAFGAPISTEAAAAPSRAAEARERVKALAARPELAKSLQAYGIVPGEAAARVDAMSDAEVLSLAGRLDALPAGGALSNEQVLLVILLVLLLVILI